MIDEILNNDGFPYAEILDDLNITDELHRIEFVEFARMFASNCYRIAKEANMGEHEELKGYYHWRLLDPAKFYKIEFTYYHSEDLIFAINSVEILTFEGYMKSVNTQKNNQIGIFNTESELANNILNVDKN